jgi:hypothetical protein
MTRTARAAYPRAMIKDRSETRTGLEGNRRSMPKDGAGGHNWGSLADERQNELAALEDASFDEEEAGAARADMPDARQARLGSESPTTSSSPPPPMSRSPSASATMTAQELEEARKLRTHAFKKTGEIDLAAIARSSAAVRASS